MKVIITLLIVLSAQIGFSQLKVSVSDGDWNNPQTWNPPVVPSFNEGSVVINHAVTATTTLEVGIDLLIIGTLGTLTTSGQFALHGNLLNDGVFFVDTLLVGDGDSLINNGILEGTYFVPSNPMNENHGEITLSDHLILSESFLNSASGVIETDQLISGDGSLVNNGSISTDGWTHDSSADGEGSFCIENCFQNTGTISGTLDICDATPNSGLPCDFNFGTVSSSVTYCATGACASTSGLLNSSIDFEVTIFPNPTRDGRFSIATDLTLDEVLVVDLTGRTVFKKSTGDLHSIDLSSLENGEYLMVIQTPTESITKRVVIAL